MTEHGSPQWAPPSGQPVGQSVGQPAAQPAAQPYGPAAQPAAQPYGGHTGYYAAAPPPVPSGVPYSGAPMGPLPVQPVQPRADGRPGPVRVEAVPGTEFGIAIASVPPTFSGQATGSLVAGSASIAVSLAVGCFGIVGGADGWGVLVSGAFAILAGLLGLAGIGLGLVATRVIKASRGRFTGRGVAISGIACGSTGVVLTAGGMLLATAAVVAS